MDKETAETISRIAAHYLSPREREEVENARATVAHDPVMAGPHASALLDIIDRLTDCMENDIPAIVSADPDFPPGFDEVAYEYRGER